MGLIWDEAIEGYPEKFKDDSEIETVDIFAKKKTTTTTTKTSTTTTKTSTTTSTSSELHLVEQFLVEQFLPPGC